MSKLRSGWFYEDVYRENIYLLWNVTTERQIAYFKKEFGVDYTEPFDCSARCTEVLDENGIKGRQVIMLREWGLTPKLISYLSHEVLHCVHHILDMRGMKLNDDTVEAYCYLYESIMRRCLEILK